MPTAYRRIHYIHHQKVVPTAWDTYEGHWTEGPLQSMVTVFPIFLLDYTTSLSEVASRAAGEFFIIILLLNLRGMLRHDERFVWLIGNHHLLHHRYPQWNYGEYWLDWLGGTLYPVGREYKRGLLYL